MVAEESAGVQVMLFKKWDERTNRVLMQVSNPACPVINKTCSESRRGTNEREGYAKPHSPSGGSQFLKGMYYDL